MINKLCCSHNIEIMKIVLWKQSFLSLLIKKRASLTHISQQISDAFFLCNNDIARFSKKSLTRRQVKEFMRYE